MEESKVLQYFVTYIIRPKQPKLWRVAAAIGTIEVVGALTSCELLHSMSDLKAAQMKHAS